jgi:hypothetical protein
LLPAGAFAGWDLHPLESTAFSRRTPDSDIGRAANVAPAPPSGMLVLVNTMLFRVLHGRSIEARV